MNYEKGFTLVELLAVLVIIGIVGSLSVPIVRKSIGSYRQDLLKQQEENFLVSFKLWGSNNLEYLPSVNSDISASLDEVKGKTEKEYGRLILTYGDLVKEGYIEKSKNPVTKEYFLDTDYQFVVVKQGDGFKYTISK